MGIYLGVVVHKSLTILICLLFITTADAQDENRYDNLDIPLDMTVETDMAIHSMLYQIGLKQRGEKVLGDKTCIDFSKNPDGTNRISLGVAADAFKLGEVGFSSDNKKTYDGVKKTIDSLMTFFKNANYKPTIKVRGYADGVHNTSSEYNISENQDQFESSNESDFSSTSKKKNKLLAKKRADEFIENFFPEDSKANVEAIGIHSPGLEDKPESQRQCDARRTAIVDITFNPKLKINNEIGKITPGFGVLSGLKNMQNTIATVFNANKTKYEDLPKYCQNESSRLFLEHSKNKVKDIKKVLSDSSKLESLKRGYEKEFNPVAAKKFCEMSYRGTHSRIVANREECIRLKAEVYNSFQNYISDPNEKSMYRYLASSVASNKSSASNTPLRSVTCSPAVSSSCKTIYNFVRKEIITAASPLLVSGQSKNSSHYLDCFSNDLFYEKEMSNFENFKRDYIISNDILNKMKNQENNEIVFSYSKENMPKVQTQRHGIKRGFVCKACANGLQLKRSSSGGIEAQYVGREDNPKMIEDQKEAQQALFNSRDPKKMFKVGQQKGLNLYIIKDCKISSSEDMIKNSKMVSLTDFENKLVEIGPNDCAFRPEIVNSCLHAPDGSGEGVFDQSQVMSSQPSFLTNKNLNLTLKSQVDTLKQVEDALKDDYIGYCGFAEETVKELDAHPSDVINGILCKNSPKIAIPSIDNNEDNDCSESQSVVRN